MFDLLCSHSNGEQSCKGGNSITWYKFTFGVDVNLNLSIGIFSNCCLFEVRYQFLQDITGISTYIVVSIFKKGPATYQRNELLVST